MIRWSLNTVRGALYAPLDALEWLDLDVPRWLLRVVVAIDAPLVAVLIPHDE